MANMLKHVHVSPQEFWSRFVQPRVAHIQNVSPLNSTHIIRDARQTLDDELDALHLAMCQLRKRRNALSLVTCLPPEVLARVFKFVALAMTPSKYNSSPQARLGWIIVTHVCTHWRETALAHPSLWGYIHSDLSLRWRKEMIARAKFAPLSIHIPYHRSDGGFVAEHGFHTRELCLSELRQNDLIPQLSTSSVPILELLSLQGSGDTAVILPVDIFASSTPPLRHITLDKVFLPWSASIFHSLTYLRISLSRTSGTQLTLPPELDHASQYDHLFGALARMPALRTLNLAYCLPSKPHSQNPAGNTLIVLPSLELLSLAGTLAECIDVAECIRIPPSSRVVLKCPGAPQQTDQSFIRFLKTHLSRGTIPCLLTLSISLSGRNADQSELVDIELWHTSSSSSAIWWGDRPKQEPFISISVPPSPASLDSLQGLCNVLPLQDLRVLKVAYDHDSWSPEAWIDIFGRCKLIEHVSVEGRNVVHFCRTLVRPGSGADETATSAEELFFRRLKTLEVCKVDLLASVETKGNKCPFDELLGEWLSMRMDIIDVLEDAEDDEDSGDSSQEDCGLDQLLITQCSITQERVDALEEYVPDLLWDEKKGIYNEDSEEEDVDGY